MTEPIRDARSAKWQSGSNKAGWRSEGVATATVPATPPRIDPPPQSGKRWGVILAGGDGARLRPLTRLISGDERPKQFCALFGGRTLLEQTLHRSERSIPPEQLMVSLNGQHEKWFAEQDGLRPSQWVVQPANKGTAPAILHSLLSLARLDAQALVAILPSDHYYSDESAFASALDCAFEVAAETTDSVVLLGARPDYPEVEYGWIELGSPLERKGCDLFRVRDFQEKPVINVARRLLKSGSVWNTFVMIGHVNAFLEMIQAALPGLREALAAARMWAGEETHIEYSVYNHIPSVCFSQKVLSAHPGKLSVVRLNDVVWSDLGDPARAVKVAGGSGCEAAWIRKWKHEMEMAPGASDTATACA